ncbi:MAG: hypothetical protein EB060_09630 [Proteobacteria bacterium]|nr:hypothetical protein [Pseudomonadota bacterium]
MSIEALQGWIPFDQRSAEDNAVFDAIVGAMPPFVIGGVGSLDEQPKRVVLWDYAKKVNGGSHLPTFRQAVGDCVSMGAANAVNYLAAMEIIRLGDREKFRPAFQPFIYGISRVQIGGGRISGDGSVGAWAAEGVRKYGILAADEPGTPAYSGDVARTWGRKPGPPQDALAAAKPHCLKSTAQVTTYEQVRDAIANGYPVTVASNRGFQMRGVRDRGKLWGSPAGSWAHQMAFIGVDDDSSRPGCYCLNSWGPDAHGAPVDDAPPGGFWVDAEVVTQMVRQGDSFAFSQFDGFPAQKLNFMLV